MQPARQSRRTPHFAPHFAMAAVVATLLAAAAHAAPTHISGAGDALLLSLASQGPTLLAAGERGIIDRSTDGGITWATIPTPTRATLARIMFTAPAEAFATGFDATILRSADAGLHWNVVNQSQKADAPIFGLVRAGAGYIATGAFGHAYTSADGIAWHATRIPDTDEDPHFNALLSTSATAILLLGESGLAMNSPDAGATWHKLTLPIHASLFGGLVTGPGHWLAYGLHGHLIATQNEGARWRELPTVTTTEYLGAALLADRRTVLVGRAGTVVLLDAQWHSARALPQETRDSYADVLQTPSGAVIAAGEGGLTTLTIPPADGAGL
jgi:photosystem II stability/assembly factor-like uncharacterized protein